MESASLRRFQLPEDGGEATPRLVRALPTPESIAQFLREMTATLQPSDSAV